MDITSISGLVGTLGFPIVAFGICCYFVKYVFDTNNKTTNETLKELKDSLDDLKETIITTFTKAGDK